MQNFCDLCGSESARLSRVDDLWGLGTSTMCEDAAACSGSWPVFQAPAAGESYETDGPFAPASNLFETDQLVDALRRVYGQTLSAQDKAAP